MRFLAVLLILVFVDICFGFCCGGGGGGGGCGCGRRKRSIENTALPFTNLAGKGNQQLCNSPELKEILTQTMKDDFQQSGKSISANLEAAGDRYVVVCSEGYFEYFIHPEMEFCGAHNTTHHCQVFVL